MAPSHGFAAASHREAALRGATASHGETAFRGSAGSVRPAAAMRFTHREMRCFAVQAARYRAARRAAMRSAHCEIRPGENVTLQYLSHAARPPPCEPPPPCGRRHRTIANGKIRAARPGRHSVEFRLVREENGNALPDEPRPPIPSFCEGRRAVFPVI
jgi:hypothetical protein